MIGRTRLCAALAACLLVAVLTAAPAAAQVRSPNPFGVPQAGRIEDGGHLPRHHAWRMERRDERLHRHGEHLGRHWRQEQRYRWHDGRL